MSRLRRTLLALGGGALAAALVGAQACGGGTAATGEGAPAPSPTSTATPTPTPVPPRELLRRSGQVMASLETFHFRLEHQRGSTELLPGLAIEEAEGDVVRPDRLSVRLAGSFGGLAVKTEVVTIGDTTYMTNPLTGKWETLPATASPLGFFSPGEGVGAMMSQVQEPTLVGDGAASTVTIGGILPARALAPLVGATLPDATVRVELTVDGKRDFLLMARIVGRVTPTDIAEAVRVITLSRFNEPLVVEAPR